MAAKAQSDFTQAKYYLQIAEGMLEALIAQLEWLIEGKQDKVIPLLPDNALQAVKDEFVEEYRRIGETIKRAEEEDGKEWEYLMDGAFTLT
ncbi:MAG: hypothetical protein RMK94_02280 [Armatimonadota bacterium]|nr:hypothetical protein [Armatimonadota bacterium]